jgi:beta-1,4-mannosyl-glycoprotein beta-1,4-N-acetylglucosaminyltransferase
LGQNARTLHKSDSLEQRRIPLERCRRALQISFLLSRICKAHGLETLDSGGVGNIPTVYDAVIFSVELDLLEIRMRELYDVVDTFIVTESNVTFSGDAREYVLEKNMDQLAFAKDKLVYIKIGDLTPHNPLSQFPKEDPFANEVKMRVGVSRAIDNLFPRVGSIILQSDVDEIPSSKAVSLLKHCNGWGDVIHLGMPSYLYSFEFPMQRSKSSSKANNGEGAGSRQWRASAKRYGTESYRGYTHSRQSDAILEKAGWHLTFAFKYIDDFVFKMK